MYPAPAPLPVVECDRCGGDATRARLEVLDARPVLPYADPAARTALYCSPACLVAAWALAAGLPA